MNYLDMLARLGVGNAHPGGYTATLEQLQQWPIPKSSSVLEVGCGTGITACYLAQNGLEVTGLDVRPDMLVKAKQRANELGVKVHYELGDVQCLPFDANTFDVVLAESVSIFTNTRIALSEYFRVLSPGGTLYDREMIAMRSISPRLTIISKNNSIFITIYDQLLRIKASRPDPCRYIL